MGALAVADVTPVVPPPAARYDPAVPTPTVLNETTSLCATCHRHVPARVERDGGQVWLRKVCEAHGAQEALLSSDADWYEATLAEPLVLTPPADGHAPAQGCPFDCGPCTRHEQRLHLPIVPITGACNLDCPICYTHNKNEGAWHMSALEVASLLAHLREAAPERRIINLTGGEPTQHPDFLRVVELCRDEGIHRITISTHGLRFLREPALLDRLVELDARIILSFDSLTDEGNQALLGGTFTRGKLAVLDLLEEKGLDTSLLPVICKGVNDHELGDILALALGREHVRSVEIHPMTFTGQSGAGFDRAARYTACDALRDVEVATGGALAVADFVPSPVAHALCYQVAVMLRVDGRWLPFTRFMSRGDLRRLLAVGLYIEPGPEVERALLDIIERLWAGEGDFDEVEPVLKALRGLVERLFAPGQTPEQRLSVAERETKAIYVHTHMDEETFDTDRIRQCPVGVREADGRNIPSCAYNVLYRPRDKRFRAHPLPPVSALGPGRDP